MTSVTRFGEISPRWIIFTLWQLCKNWLIKYLGKFLTHCGQAFMLLVKFSLLQMAKYWKNNEAIWSHWWWCQNHVAATWVALIIIFECLELQKTWASFSKAKFCRFKNASYFFRRTNRFEFKAARKIAKFWVHGKCANRCKNIYYLCIATIFTRCGQVIRMLDIFLQSCLSLPFFCKIVVVNKKENKQKEAGVGPLKYQF